MTSQNQMRICTSEILTPAITAVSGFRVKCLIYLFAAQEQIAIVHGGEIGADKVRVYLRQFRLQTLQAADRTLNFRPAQQLYRLQPVKSGNQGIWYSQR